MTCSVLTRQIRRAIHAGEASASTRYNNRPQGMKPNRITMDQPSEMQAGVFVEKGRIEPRTMPTPTAGEGEVLLRVVGCGVCGTDYHIFHGEHTRGVVPPVVLGHEIATRIETIGAGVRGLRPGQFAAVDPLIGCGSCRYCRTGRPNLCPDPTIIGYRRHGGFAQYMTAPASHVIPMDESVGIAGAILCETLACVLRGYERLGLVAGGSAMVLGAGTVGLLWAQMFRHSPISRLIQTEPSAFRRNLAAELGADLVIDPNANDVTEQVRAVLPDGVDYIVDATGEAAAIQPAIDLLAPGGTLMIFGVCPPDQRVIFSPYEAFAKETRIIASKMPPQSLEPAARLIESGRIPANRIVTTTRPLAELSDAVSGFERYREQQVKVAIDPWA
jgi:2-desacetyl-2-hydroxyethyl bacteriochlorophyllide A dehydrogenase